MGAKTAQVWRESKMVRETLRRRGVESKIVREMLCFTIETGLGGREGRRCRTGGCGLGSRYVRASLALGAGHSAMAGVFRGRGQARHVRHTIGECKCRLLDAL